MASRLRKSTQVIDFFSKQNFLVNWRKNEKKNEKQNKHCRFKWVRSSLFLNYRLDEAKAFGFFYCSLSLTLFLYRSSIHVVRPFGRSFVQLLGQPHAGRKLFVSAARVCCFFGFFGGPMSFDW